MNRRTFNSSLLRTAAIAAALFLAAALSAVHAQTPAPTIDPAAADANAGDFRTETRKVDGGAELVTIFARRDTEKRDGARREIPLVSVLRDTLGDDDPQNDRIRYVWTLTHPKPSLNQKVAASIPFFYNRAGNKVTAGNKAPPAALDLTPSYKGSFDKIAKFAINTFVVGLFDYPVRAPYRRYNFNRGLYKDSSLATASTVLEYYDAERSDNALASDDVSDIQARAKLNGEMFGWHISNDLLPQIDESAVEKERDIRSHNWELLRQYSDHQDVYFEPLKMPDGQARMAIVWTSAEDVEKNRGRKFDKRFFNIKSPWNDAKLAGWRGYTETRWFDQDGRRVAEGTPGSYSRRMIPLAVYGLDHPKIPILLVDMRKSGNPQMRELTRPLINDVFGAARAYTGLGWITSLLGRNVIGFFTGRRGEDIYQSSRVRSIAQLKVFLALDNELHPELSRAIAGKIERASINPLENDLSVQLRLAQEQYENLIAYASRPDGLPLKLQLDRREELVGIRRSAGKRMWYSFLHFASFGSYTFREKATPNVNELLSQKRKLEFHERRLLELTADSIRPEIDSNIAEIRESLEYVADNGGSVGGKAAASLTRIYASTHDAGIRDLCLSALYKADSPASKKELLAIYNDERTSQTDRERTAQLLRQALTEGKRIAPRDIQAIEALKEN